MVVTQAGADGVHGRCVIALGKLLAGDIIGALLAPCLDARPDDPLATGKACHDDDGERAEDNRDTKFMILFQEIGNGGLLAR